MNSGVITKVEYKPTGASSFTELAVIPHSGTISEQNKEIPAGNIFMMTAGFKVAGINPATDTILNNLAGPRAIYKITDANGTVYTIGDSSYRARLSYTHHADGAPGSFNGYDCEVTRQAPTGCPTV